MGLLGKAKSMSKEIKETAQWCEELRNERAKETDILARWQRKNEELVLPLAQRALLLKQARDQQGYLDVLKEEERAIWDRDRDRDAHQRRIEQLYGDIRSITAPVINEEIEFFRAMLPELGDKKIIQKVETRETVAAGPMIVYSSNFGTVAKTKEKILETARILRGMDLQPLAQILEFVQKARKEFGEIDFSILKTEPEEITEARFEELSQAPDVKIYRTARFVGNRIEKDFNLPIREER